MNAEIFENRNLPPTVPGGCLIAFEGIDGSGKTTMARMAAEQLTMAGVLNSYLREPTDGPHGRQLRQIMVSSQKRDARHEFELFVLDRKDDVIHNIQPILDRGGVVCIDRYYISSMAYQGALGLDPQMIRRENEKFAPVPHLILRYRVSIDTALARITASRTDGANQFEKRDYLQKVDHQFEQMNFPQMINLDSEKPLEALFAETWPLITGELLARLEK